MAFKVPEHNRVKTGPMRSSENDGCNGVFEIWLSGRSKAEVIASDGAGWEHCSVVIQNPVDKKYRTPTWAEMCKIKDLFWDNTDCVVQFHPPETDYVNFHKHCLHLWRPVDMIIPIPPTELVGPVAKIKR